MSAIREFFEEYYPGVDVLEVEAANPAELEEKLRRYIETGSFDPPPVGVGFDAPVGWNGNQSGAVWPQHYFDANPIGTAYAQGRHTGADLNDNVTAGWDSDRLAPTFAVADGVVTQAGVLGGTWGNVVVIDHGPVGPFNKVCSRYGHLNDFVVQVGQTVTRGQQIGRIGNAFNQLAYHLHFDISPNNTLINNPGDWPGNDFGRVVRNYLEPRSFIRLSRPGMAWPEAQPGTINANVNFRTGPGTSFAVNRTLAAGTAVAVLNTLDGWCLLMLADWSYGWCHENFVDTEDMPPPTGGYEYNGRPVTFRPALHGPADDWAWQLGEVQGVHRQVNAPIKFLSNGINADYFPGFNKPQFHIVRIMWNAHAATPAEFWDEVRGDFGRMVNAGARQFEIHNEPNLPGEGLGTAWANGAEFGAWLRDVVTLIRAQYGSTVKLYYPGCSPGVPWTNQFAFTNAAWPVARPYLDGFCLHAYTGNNSNVETAAAEIVNQVIEAQAYLNLQVPLVVSEASVNRGTNYEQKAQVYRRVEQLLNGRPGIEAVCWFISDWRNPPPEQAGNGEAWVGTSLPTYYMNG